MSFDYEEFKIKLSVFGTIYYSAELITSTYVNLEFVLNNPDIDQILINISNLITNEILPYFPILINMNVDSNRMKASFKRQLE